MENLTKRMRFRVEAILPRVGAVMARQLDESNFVLTESTTLGGCPVAGFDIPRKINADGSLDLGTVGFFLKDSRDLSSYRPAEIVLLEHWADS